MHHFVTEMCTHVHISVTKWCIVEYETSALWDLWIRSIEKSDVWEQKSVTQRALKYVRCDVTDDLVNSESSNGFMSSNDTCYYPSQC